MKTVGYCQYCNEKIKFVDDTWILVKTYLYLAPGECASDLADTHQPRK